MIAENDGKSSNMSAENTFKACRMCRKPETHVTLTSLFAGNGEKAEIFMLVAETDISKDEDKYDALICDPCFKNVAQAYDVIARINKAENDYFELKRRTNQKNRSNKSAAKSSKKVASQSVKTPSKTRNSIKGKSKLSLICSNCKKLFSSKSSLKAHRENVHEKLKRFQCEECNVGFYFNRDYQKHLIDGKCKM